LLLGPHIPLTENTIRSLELCQFMFTRLLQSIPLSWMPPRDTYFASHR
jgi:hypothetical protein